ncbi:hypothetical protein N9O33_08670, partial [Gammaproteobacteria bacterium]|nr:hypothetical protein [Gammaproteobacteria bacterium]
IDQITGGAGADTITGGAGADVMSSGGGIDTFVFSSGDSQVVTVASGTTALTTADIITAPSSGSVKINLADMGSTIADVAVASLTFGTTVMVGTTVNDILIMEGTLSAGKVFTAVADGTAGNTHTLIQVDTNGTTAGGIENILLVGVFDDTASSIASEVLTLVI